MSADTTSELRAALCPYAHFHRDERDQHYRDVGRSIAHDLVGGATTKNWMPMLMGKTPLESHKPELAPNTILQLTASRARSCDF
jgi:hypothetical protein